jgi:hypothetical protein
MTENAIISEVHNSPYMDKVCEDGYHHLKVRFDDGAEVEAWSAEGRYRGQRVIVDIRRHTEAERRDALKYGVTLPEREYRIVERLAF